MTHEDSNGHEAGSPTATVDDVAAHFGVSTKTVRRWLKNTDIPHRRIGGVIRFDIDEVDEWARREPAPNGSAA